MNELSIHVDHLGKQYRIGSLQPRYRTLRESIGAVVRAPFRRAASLIRGDAYGASEMNETIWALKDLTFDVHAGESVGIIGRNGAGKSTLLKILSRITEPTEGRARIYGRVGSLLEVGTGFHPELTGRENIYLNGAIIGMRRLEIDRRFDEIVAFAEIEKFLDTPVKHFSSGMYTRLAFSVAAHLEPEILMVDEVLAVGDAQFQNKCLGKMSSVVSQGRTVLFVSHNMNAIEQLCQHCIYLDRGRMVDFSSDVRAVIKSYLYGQEDTPGQNAWVNAGDEYQNMWIKPLRFFLGDEQGNLLNMPVRNDEDAWVYLAFETRMLDPGLTIGYALYAEDGSLLYWSYQTDDAAHPHLEMKKGPCMMRSRLPKRYLNEGTYRLEMIASLHFRQWLLEPGNQVPVIYLTIQGGLSESPFWIMKRPGLLAPVISWEEVTPEMEKNGQDLHL
jgi:lipopolysaccharide transport system ATP-binding protein